MTFHYTYNYPQAARDGGFKLRNYKDGPLDWRLIGSIETERIVRDQSFEQIDAVLNHLAEAPLASILDSHILDSGIAKYFMLSQFSVQYLLFCRKFLEETVADLRESHNNSQMELATAKRSLSEAKTEILQLHKKLTQMEAIHEVLYPCHLCTKNFVSNDSLNLHISRKHNGSFVNPGKKAETNQAFCKERETDLTLINTIKLELEIKHLKERLNNAEREIKEKSLESGVKHCLEKLESKHVHSIGIQSNLSEIKESDDSGQNNDSISFENRQQLSTLQNKLQEFENWKEGQILQNSEILNELNSKIQEMSASLEIKRNQIEMQTDNEKQKPLSAEELEKILAKKVEEIGKTTVANLEDTAKKIEIDYKEKLQIFEKELIRLNKHYVFQNDPVTERSAVKDQDVSLDSIQNENESTAYLNPKVNEYKNHPKDNRLDEETSDSESNHTFVKNNVVVHLENNSNNDDESPSPSDTNDEDCTDLSDSLPDEDISKKTFSEGEGIDTVVNKKGNENKHLRQMKPKLLTKQYAEKITNKRLSSLGVDTKSKTLTLSLKKRYLDLNEKKLKSKQKNSRFYVTRNKIKNFVDKLCSPKVPFNTEAVLKATEDNKPKAANYLSSDKEFLSEEEASSIASVFPLPENKNLKQRLESILASPIRTPNDDLIEDVEIKKVENKKPIPIPRKRVMFNQPEMQKNHTDHT